MLHMKCLSKCPYSKKSILPEKVPGCVPINSMLAFHPNFHTNVWFLANLPIYRKLNYDNISHVFYMIYKIVCTYKYLHWKLDIYIYIYTYILFLVINIGIMIFVSVISKRKKLFLFIIISVAAKFPKDIFPIVPLSVIMSMSLKLHQPSTIPDLLRIGSQNRKC